ncbi:MAG: NEAT domain-containing protein, partial [Peptostreptococcaceae bacterium]
EVKDGKTYLTFEMSGYNMMGSIKIKVDGKTVNHTQTDLGNDKVKFIFEVPSIDSKITMSMYVNPMSSTVEYGVGLNTSTLKYISSNEEPALPEKPVDNNNLNNSNSSNNSSSSETVEEDKTGNEVTEDTKVVGKLYTIKNQVSHSNATGQQMARKYLNSTSKIEEINGKYYATFTFTGQDLMKDHKIYVNGSRVSHSVVAKSGDSISIRFALPSLDAKIKVELFVIPMSRTIDFEVKLLEDTLTFVKEFDAGSGTLPQTGSILSTELMMGAGGIVTVTGFLVGKRKRK